MWARWMLWSRQANRQAWLRRQDRRMAGGRNCRLSEEKVTPQYERSVRSEVSATAEGAVELSMSALPQ